MKRSGIELAPTDRTLGDIRAALDPVLTDPRYANAATAAATHAHPQPPLDHGHELHEAQVAQPALS